MVRSIGAQLGLLAFSAAIIAGLWAGNSVSTILLRAVFAMFLASLVGQLIAWTARLVLRDHLQKKKLAIDRQHQELVRARQSEAAAAAPASAAGE